jgi:hypothetical protein
MAALPLAGSGGAATIRGGPRAATDSREGTPVQVRIEYCVV